VEQDRQERRERHFYFWEEHLVGTFPRLNLTSPPDKSGVKMKTLHSYIKTNQMHQFLKLFIFA
jgi:hypothetical protein